MNKFKKILFIGVTLTLLVSCKKYLDVIPDNIATIDYAFSMRSTAERYLFTCYSWLPAHASFSANPGFLAGDELVCLSTNTIDSWAITRGQQNVLDPLLNYWDGGKSGKALYQGIRDCNIFLENISRVPDMQPEEKDRWIGEVKFLKAYYHFWLMRMYGPIPIIRENLPIDATIDQVKAYREPIDSCVDYVVQLLDEAGAVLPDVIESESSELGRVSKSIALALKAYVLVTAASPLFNGNADYPNLIGKNGEPLFNPQASSEKWQKALTACTEAIDLCETVGFSLYTYATGIGQTAISDTTKIQMGLRNAVSERINKEVIWSNTNSLIDQVALTPRSWDPSRVHSSMSGRYGPPLKMVELFYSDNGVPINEDKTWKYAERFELRKAEHVDRYDIKEGYTTIGLHFNRENRFYASVGFDGGIWYGQGRTDENNAFYIMSKSGQAANIYTLAYYSATSYWPKKLINTQNVIEAASYTVRWYGWPVIRLADLYLLHAEAANEVNGPVAETFKYIDKVRERAGLQPVLESWKNYSSQPSKPTTKEGLREIIQQERSIELAFEGQRYWDLRRWKTALEELNTTFKGWDNFQSNAAAFYRPVSLLQRSFLQRDYWWPIKEESLLKNNNLLQNPGW